MRVGWEYKKLGDVCQVVTGSTPKTNNSEYWDGNYPWVTPAELKGEVYISDTARHITEEAIAHTNLTLLPIGTVLLSSRAPIGKVAITTIEMYCNQGFKNLICSDAINNKYLYLWLSGKTEYLNSLGRGATFKEISKTIVENVIIPLPPLSIQKSIVSELDKINELIRLKKEQLKDYDNLAQSIFYEMFGDPVVNEKGWEVKKLGELGTIVTGSTPSTKIKEYYCSNDYCFIKPSDLPAEGYQIIVESENYISSKGYEVSRKLPKGSVLVSCIGIIGKTAILGMDACTNQQINAIIPNEYVNNKFLAYSILSQRYVLSSVANAPVVPLINKSDFSKVEIPLPPLSTQQSIVSELDKINELIRLKKEQLKDYDNLAQSIFYEMFGDEKYERRKLKDIVKVKSGQVSPLEDPYCDMVHVGPANIESNTGRLINLKTAKEENLISGKYLFDSSMVLYSKIRPNLNKVTIADFEGICSADMYPLIPSKSIDKKFLLFILKQKEFLSYAIANSGRANIPKINREALLEYSTILPPLSLQLQFAERLALIEKQKEQISSIIKDLETLLASRMQYWFD